MRKLGTLAGMGFIAAAVLSIGCANDSISKEESVEGAMKKAGLKAGPPEPKGGVPKKTDAPEGQPGGAPSNSG